MSAATCHVERLRLFRFRNYADETVELGPGLTVISGRNAQGKTSLLEAVATLALTRSPRAATTAELVSWGAPEGRVEAVVVRPDGPRLLDMRIRVGLTGAPAGAAGAPTAPPDDAAAAPSDRTTRTTLVDGKERPARALLGLCPVVLFWPDDLMLVKGAPAMRRRLCDVVLSQLDPRVAAELVRYRRILDQRNALLRQIRAGAATTAPLAGFTASLATSGGAVRVARARLCAALDAMARDALAELSGGREHLSLRYAPDGGDGAVPDDPDAAAVALAAELADRAPEELARGLTVAGPHRDDVEFLLDGRPARSTASQGQQRSCVLACKLAEVRHVTERAGMAPVLLLDDVLSELDAGRRSRLLEALGAGSTSQALLTTAEDRSGALDGLAAASRLHIEAGHATPVAPRSDGSGTDAAGAGLGAGRSARTVSAGGGTAA